MLHTSWLNQQLQIPVGPDVTPLLQLADVAVIAQGKVAGEKRKEELQLLLHESARRESTEYTARFGKFEVFEVAKSMASRQSELQCSRDTVLAVSIQSGCLALRPDEDGKLVKVSETSLDEKFPSFPTVKGLQPNWVAGRFSSFNCVSGVPRVPEWDKLGSVLEAESVPTEVEAGDMVLEVATLALAESLTAEESKHLEGPVRQWASMELPPQLASQKSKPRRASGGTTKWGERLKLAFQKGRSREWLERLKLVGSGKPVPRISKKKRSAGQLDADRVDEAKSGPVLSATVRKGKCGKSVASLKKKLKSGAVGTPASGSVSLKDHKFVGQQVRVVGEGAAAQCMGGVYTVTEAVEQSGQVSLRLQSDRMHIRYALESQVVLVSDEVKFSPPAKAVIDYRQFNVVKRREVAKSLSRDIVPAKVKELLHSSTLQWGVAELLYRLPVLDSIAVVSVEESRAIVNMQSAIEAEFKELQAVRERLNSQGLVLVLLHSESPQHYTLLRRVLPVDGVPVITYFESLAVPSPSAISMAEKFMDRMTWTGRVPSPVNSRHQSEGWECGLYAMQFLEECMRESRGELVIRGPVKVEHIIARVNEYIRRVQPWLPVDTLVAIPVPLSAEEVRKEAARAVERAVPVASGPVLSQGLPPIGDAPKSAVAAVDVGELTLEQAQSSRSTCSKCRRSGCSSCMGEWFIPKKMLKFPRSKSKIILDLD